MAMFMACGAITKPCPRSESIVATAAASCRIFGSGVGLMSPSRNHWTYSRIMFDTPCDSMPRRSAYMSTSAACRASASGMPIS